MEDYPPEGWKPEHGMGALIAAGLGVLIGFSITGLTPSKMIDDMIEGSYDCIHRDLNDKSMDNFCNR